MVPDLDARYAIRDLDPGTWTPNPLIKGSGSIEVQNPFV